MMSANHLFTYLPKQNPQINLIHYCLISALLDSTIIREIVQNLIILQQKWKFNNLNMKLKMIEMIDKPWGLDWFFTFLNLKPFLQNLIVRVTKVIV